MRLGECFWRKRDLKSVQKLDDGFRFLVSHGRMAGKAEFLLVDALGDRQGKRVPRLIALLLVGRKRIVDFRTYVVGFQVCLQLIATLRQDRENVPDTIPVGLRYDKLRIVHLIYI